MKQGTDMYYNVEKKMNLPDNTIVMTWSSFWEWLKELMAFGQIAIDWSPPLTPDILLFASC
jgi:hypothetical protein